MRRFLLCLLLAFGTLAFAQDRTNARSMVISPYGIVASSQVQASQAGAEILSRGGSAVDAAIATNAVLGVMEPDMNGMGGDLFAIYWDAKTGKLYGLNASGWAPRGLTIDYLKSKKVTHMPDAGIDTVTVPGAVEGWNKLHERFGRLAWKDLFAPAIGFSWCTMRLLRWGKYLETLMLLRRSGCSPKEAPGRSTAGKSRKPFWRPRGKRAGR
jgi:gamma-glutamyltranspeptidase/glutathione hydrolase